MLPLPQRRYSQLSLDERRKIERWRAAKVSVDLIAEKLGRHRSTIFRELRRNTFADAQIPEAIGYFGLAADRMRRDRRSRLRKLVRLPSLAAAIAERIRHGWSPEQIAGRLALERSPVRVCHETIYRYAYSPEGQALALWRHLPERRVRRRRKVARRQQLRRFGAELSILNRPDKVRERRQFGHWECDLIQFKKKFGKANLTSLVERVSRFSLLLRNNDRQSKPIMDGLIDALAPLPHTARRSITFDRGTEFTDWPYLQAGLGVQTWFCDPQSPWQKGSVDNNNRRARRWLPRELDPLAVDHQQLKRVCDQLNSTPRKCLGFKTPAEVFRQRVLATQKVRQ